MHLTLYTILNFNWNIRDYNGDQACDTENQVLEEKKKNNGNKFKLTRNFNVIYRFLQ